MVPTIIILVAVLALAAAILLLVAVGIGGKSGNKEDSEFASKLVAHLNGEAKPPQVLVDLYEDLPSMMTGEDDLVEEPTVLLPVTAESPQPGLEPQVDEFLRRQFKSWEISVRRRRQLALDVPPKGTVRQRRWAEEQREAIIDRRVRNR